jgi:hypothetical protein
LLILLSCVVRFASHPKESPYTTLVLLLLLLAVGKWHFLFFNLLSGFVSLGLGLARAVVILLLGRLGESLRSLDKGLRSRRVISAILRILVILTLSLTLENVEKSVCTSHEIWMVGVYMGIFNFDELDDHVSGRSETFVQNLFHHIRDLIL